MPNRKSPGSGNISRVFRRHCRRQLINSIRKNPPGHREVFVLMFMQIEFRVISRARGYTARRQRRHLLRRITIRDRASFELCRAAGFRLSNYILIIITIIIYTTLEYLYMYIYAVNRGFTLLPPWRIVFLLFFFHLAISLKHSARPAQSRETFRRALFPPGPLPCRT